MMSGGPPRRVPSRRRFIQHRMHRARAACSVRSRIVVTNRSVMVLMVSGAVGVHRTAADLAAVAAGVSHVIELRRQSASKMLVLRRAARPSQLVVR